MRLLNQMLNLSRIFDCFSRRFAKFVINLKLSNFVHSDVPSQRSYLSNYIRHMWKSTIELGNREIKIHVYAKRQAWICTTWPSFPLIFRLLFIASTQK